MTDEREPSAAGAGSVLYLPEGRVSRAERGRVWLYDGALLFRRRGDKRPLLRAREVRRVEEVHGDWLDLKHYRLHTEEVLVDLVPVGAAAPLRALVERVAREAGVPIVARELDSVIQSHLQALWNRGLAGRIALGAEVASLALLLAYAYVAA